MNNRFWLTVNAICFPINLWFWHIGLGLWFLVAASVSALCLLIETGLTILERHDPS